MRSMKTEHIDAVAKALLKGEKNARTYKDLAKRLRCTRATVERRVAAYAKREGKKVQYTRIREGARGAESEALYL